MTLAIMDSKLSRDFGIQKVRDRKIETLRICLVTKIRKCVLQICND